MTGVRVIVLVVLLSQSVILHADFDAEPPEPEPAKPYFPSDEKWVAPLPTTKTGKVAARKRISTQSSTCELRARALVESSFPDSEFSFTTEIYRERDIPVDEQTQVCIRQDRGRLSGVI